MLLLICMQTRRHFAMWTVDTLQCKHLHTADDYMVTRAVMHLN